MRKFSFKKMFFSLFSITETTDKGKKWKRIGADTSARWSKMVKLSEYKMEAVA